MTFGVEQGVEQGRGFIPFAGICGLPNIRALIAKAPAATWLRSMAGLLTLARLLEANSSPECARQGD